MRDETRFVIIGAGPTGLGAATRLEAQGEREFVILEAFDTPGGLAASFRDTSGFTWDLGSHLHYSHYQQVDRCWDAALGPEQWLHHQRSTWVWIADRFVPYPLQLNLHRLPDPARKECIRGLLVAAENPVGERLDFRAWILATFGQGIAAHFLLPYNAKLWAHPLEQMSSQWIAQRVAVPDIADILRRVEREEDSNQWGPNATFRYPRRGGSGAVWKAVADMLPPGAIRYNEGVVGINADRRIVCTAKGSEFCYDYLISSMPLDRLAGTLESGGDIGSVIVSRRHRQRGPLAPRVGSHLAERDGYFETSCQLDTVSRAKTLTATATHVIGIGLEGQPPEVVQGKLWIYYPEPSVPFYRVTIMSNLSPENTPRPGETWSLMAEVSESAFRSLPTQTPGGIPEPEPLSEQRPTYIGRFPDGESVQNVIEGLRSVGLVRRDDRIVSRWHRRLSHGYPVPTRDRDEILDQTLPALRDLGIYSRGRFGAWKYEVGNQDHAFMQGVEAVEQILHGHRELTLAEPDLVNSRYNPFPYPEWQPS